MRDGGGNEEFDPDDIHTFLTFINYGDILNKDVNINLKKITIVKDDSEQYYFKYPSSPKINSIGKILITDKDQLLIFNKDGKFVKNIYKRGEGPGELLNILGVWPGKDHFVVFNSSPGKMLVYNYKGTLMNEVYFKKNIYKSKFFSYSGNKYYFTEEEYENTQRGTIILDTKVKLFTINEEGKFLGYQIPWISKKYYLGKRTVMNLSFIQYGTEDNNLYYVASTGLYQLYKLDLFHKEINILIKKDYPKINIRKEWRKFTHPFTYKVQKKYARNTLDDILKIRVDNGKIWLFTSTFNEQNVVKVDVYDKSGTLKGVIDFPMPKSLHLAKLSYLPLTFYKDQLWIFEDLESEGFSLVGYQIQNIPSWAK